MQSRTFLVAVLIVLAAAAFLRGAWLTADPPVRRAVGIVWHDEGAWVHNARNRALWGTWRTDAWNPVFIAPVFTALEYGAFAALGVGTWQARVVPALSGFAAVICLMIGLHALAGRRAAIIGGGLLATNYAFVMWNRAALMESTMTMWMVAAWMAWALADRRPWWGAIAGLAAVAAFFTKAAAACFVAALAIEIGITAVNAWRGTSPDRRLSIAPAAFAAAGLVVAALAIGLLFVLPHWADYQFYNWQMSVTRKPGYALADFVQRASWLPVVQGLFSRMWVELAAGVVCVMALVVRWPAIRPAERLLVLWVFVGLAELVAHDSGNERRYVMFIPAIVALASLLLGSAAAIIPASLRVSRRMAVLALVVLVPVCYLAAGSFLRPFMVEGIEAGRLAATVRLAAGAAVVATLVAAWRGRALLAWAGGRVLPTNVAAVLALVAVGWNVAQWADWAWQRTTCNHDAAVAIGRLVPDGTLVQGKLANGMSLENRIRPLFVGNGFGNYDDRLRRDDARYILTYDLPEIGYESSRGSGLIQGILDHYPGRRIVASFTVDETRGEERAVLIDKFPDDSPAHARD